MKDIGYIRDGLQMSASDITAAGRHAANAAREAEAVQGNLHSVLDGSSHLLAEEIQIRTQTIHTLLGEAAARLSKLSTEINNYRNVL